MFHEPMRNGNDQRSVDNNPQAQLDGRVEPLRRKLFHSRPPLPEWMQNYFAWHKSVKRNLNRQNWNETKYIIMSCTLHEHQCGGISDRLKPLPFIVLEAYRSKRLLLIQWSKPKPLEAYFIPPEDGVDWHVPDWMIPLLQRSRHTKAYSIADIDHRLKVHRDVHVFKVMLQTPSAGETYYGEQPDSQSTYIDVFHDLFRSFFAPSPRLAALIDSKMKEHNLVPGDYAAAHLRAMYGNRIWRHPRETIELTVNSINCASRLLPGGPVYFAADIKFAVDVAREYAQQRNLPIVFFDYKNDPIHIDKDSFWRKRNVSDYDDTFFDLYMLGQSRCVTYSNGGFGTFGSLISYNPNCTLRHFKRRRIFTHCNWTNADGSTEKIELPKMNIPPEMLVRPEKISRKRIR